MKSKEAGERLSWWHQGNNDALDEGKYSTGRASRGRFFLPSDNNLPLLLLLFSQSSKNIGIPNSTPIFWLDRPNFGTV